MNRFAFMALLFGSLASSGLPQGRPYSCVAEIRPDGSLGPCNGASGGGGGSRRNGGGNPDTPRYLPFGPGDPRCLPGSFQNGRDCITDYGGYGPADIARHRALLERIDKEGWTQKAAQDYLAAARKYGWPVAYYNYAIVEKQLGNYNEAYPYFKQVAACGFHAGPYADLDGLVCDLAREQAGFVERHYGLEALKSREFGRAEVFFRQMLEHFTSGGQYPGCQHHTELQLDRHSSHESYDPKWVSESSREREGHCDMTIAYIDLALALEGRGQWGEAHKTAAWAMEEGASTRGTKYCDATNDDFDRACHDESPWLPAAVELVNNTQEGGEYEAATRLIQTADTSVKDGPDWKRTMADALQHLLNATYWDANFQGNRLRQDFHPRGLYVLYDGTELPGQYHSYTARALMASLLHVQGLDSEAEDEANIALLQHPGDAVARLTLDTIHRKDLDAALAHGFWTEHWPITANRVFIDDMNHVREKCSFDTSTNTIDCPHHLDHFLTADVRAVYVGASPLSTSQGGGCRVVPGSSAPDCDAGWLPQRDGSFWRMKFPDNGQTRCERAANGVSSTVDCYAAAMTVTAPPGAAIVRVAPEGTSNWLPQTDGSQWRIYLGSDNRWHCQTAKNGKVTEVSCAK